MVPNGTALREVYYTETDNRAYVDFSPDISTKHWGGTTGETCTVYSIVNTIVKNFPEVKSVQLLIDGEIYETLAGHIDLRNPLREKEGITGARNEESENEEMP